MRIQLHFFCITLPPHAITTVPAPQLHHLGNCLIIDLFHAGFLASHGGLHVQEVPYRGPEIGDTTRLPESDEINMKRFFKNFGWVCLGIFLQFKFNILYGIVFLENLNFHDRTYYVEMKLDKKNSDLRILNVGTTVHHSLGSDYFANVYIPDRYQVLNQKPYQGTEVMPGYLAYKMPMKRKYRDVLATADFIIAPATKEEEVSPTPIVVHFENLKQRLHTDKSYVLSLKDRQIQLEGPEIAEKTYPQKWGM